MKRMLIGLLALLSACAAIPKPSLGESPKGSVDYFTDKRGCILLYNMRTEVFDRVIGESCSDEFPAASTFKIPLAVMAFDSGILQDENSILKWSGKKEKRKILNRDQDAKSWMSQSVVWFSQRLTTTLGEARLQQYLDNFNYGNKDISAGLADAWLVSPSQKGRGLRLSPYQQIDFLKKLWTSRLPVSERSMQLARELLFLETTPNGLRVSGKMDPGTTSRAIGNTWDGLWHTFTAATSNT